MANIGLAQVTRSGSTELPLVTSGDDIASIGRMLSTDVDSYTAADVVNYLI